MCKCSSIFSEADSTKHFDKCNEFSKYYNNFHATFRKLLNHYSNPKEDLLIIRVLLKQYVNFVEDEIKK